MNDFSRKAGLIFVVSLFLASGAGHFVLAPFFMRIMPPYLPLHREAVYVSGVFEILCALALLFPATRKPAGIGLFVLTVLVTPANIHMWLHPELFTELSPTLLLWRLPAQAALLAIIWFSAIKPEPEKI